MTWRQAASVIAKGLFLAASISCAAPARADNLSTLIDRYVEWRGGVAFEHLQSFHLQGELDTAGLRGTEALWADRSGHQKVDSDLGVLKQVQVVVPDHSWDTTASGQVEAMARSDVQSLSRGEALQFPDFLRSRAGARASLAPKRMHDGRTWAVVRVTFGDQDTYDVLIDGGTGELGGFQIVEDRQKRFEGFGDWRVVDGLRMPFLQTTKTEAPGGDQTVKVTSVELNQPIPSAELARPPAIHRAGFKGRATSTQWIDFEFFQGDRIFLPAKVNGHDTVILLDSGATVSAIDKTFASSLGLAPKGGFTAPGTGGVDTTGFVGGVNVQIGDLILKSINAAAFDLKPIAGRIGHPMPFVLGDEVFNELAVDIDFAHHRLAFREPAGMTPPGGAAIVSLSRIFGNRSVPVAIEGAAPAPFEFDLGNGGPPEVYPAYYQAHELLHDRRTSQVLGGGVGGFHPTTIASLHKLTFAGVDFHEVPVTFTADTLSGSNSNVVVGNIGLSILARFRLIVDYPDDRLYAAPYEGAAFLPFDKDRLGMSLKKVADHIEVEFVSPGSPAQAVGFKIGDMISRLGDKPATEWTEAMLATVRYGRAGEVLIVTLTDNVERKVVLTNFF